VAQDEDAEPAIPLLDDTTHLNEDAPPSEETRPTMVASLNNGGFWVIF
jgi:hypothetical protein